MLETLAPIREKIEAGTRLDFEDGVTLMESTTCWRWASLPTLRGAFAAAATRSTSSRASTCTRRTSVA
jgi:hypothetical protein